MDFRNTEELLSQLVRQEHRHEDPPDLPDSLLISKYLLTFNLYNLVTSYREGMSNEGFQIHAFCRTTRSRAKTVSEGHVRLQQEA